MIQQNYNNAELYAKTSLDAEHPVSFFFLIFAGYEFTIPRVIKSIMFIHFISLLLISIMKWLEEY